MPPIQIERQAANAACHGNKTQECHTQWFAQNQTGDNADAVRRLATVDPDERTRNSLKTMLLGIDTVWLEAEWDEEEEEEERDQ